jgi:cytochrome c-type biogenesis protein
MDSFLTFLTEALEGSYILAVFASAAWGVASILLSPCHLSSIPLIVGYLSTTKESKPSRAVFLSFVFATGILIMIAIVGAITAAVGRMMGDIGIFGRYAVALVYFATGLSLMDFLRLPESSVQLRPGRIRSMAWSALVLGLLFGLALGPCTFAFMAPVLGVVLRMSTTDLVAAGGLLLAFGLGHCGVIVAAGGLVSRVQAYLDWTNRSNAVLWTRRVAGALVILAGVYSLSTS